MSVKAKLELTFDDSSTPSRYGSEADFNAPRTEEGEKYVAQHLQSELQVESRWGDFLDSLPEIPTFYQPVAQSFYIEELFTSSFDDRKNTEAVWFEISATLRRSAILLAQSRAYYEAEHNLSPETAFNARINTHLNKMDKFDLGIVLLAKSSDLVARLIFERLGASLIKVDFSDPDWDRQVTLGKIRQAFEKRTEHPELLALSDDEYSKVLGLLTNLTEPDFVKTIWNYRIRLVHRVTPAVDYPGLYAQLQNRLWKPLLDKAGAIKGHEKIGGISGKESKDYIALYEDAAKTLKHFIDKLKELHSLPRFGLRSAA